MKKVLVALGFAVIATSVNANISSGSLTVVGNAPVTIVPSDGGWGGGPGLPDEGIYTSGVSGTLRADASGTFNATYLGQAAGFQNQFASSTMQIGGSNMGVAVGTTLSQTVTAGSLIDFSFIDGGPHYFPGDFSTVFKNGDANAAFQGMIFLDAAVWNGLYGTAYDFLIGYNDSNAVDTDYDDYVVGVVNSVPVPAALPLMASALGMFGLSRRKNKAKIV